MDPDLRLLFVEGAFMAKELSLWNLIDPA